MFGFVARLVLVVLVACGAPSPADEGQEQLPEDAGSESSSLVGVWAVVEVQMLEEDGMYPLRNVSGSLEVKVTGVASLTLSDQDYESSFMLDVVERDDGTTGLVGYAIDFSCTAVGDVADCIDSGDTDWDWDDPDRAFGALSLVQR